MFFEAIRFLHMNKMWDFTADGILTKTVTFLGQKKVNMTNLGVFTTLDFFLLVTIGNLRDGVVFTREMWWMLYMKSSRKMWWLL